MFALAGGIGSYIGDEASGPSAATVPTGPISSIRLGSQKPIGKAQIHSPRKEGVFDKYGAGHGLVQYITDATAVDLHQHDARTAAGTSSPDANSRQKAHVGEMESRGLAHPSLVGAQPVPREEDPAQNTYRQAFIASGRGELDAEGGLTTHLLTFADEPAAAAAVDSATGTTAADGHGAGSGSAVADGFDNYRSKVASALALAKQKHRQKGEDPVFDKSVLSPRSGGIAGYNLDPAGLAPRTAAAPLSSATAAVRKDFRSAGVAGSLDQSEVLVKSGFAHPTSSRSASVISDADTSTASGTGVSNGAHGHQSDELDAAEAALNQELADLDWKRAVVGGRAHVHPPEADAAQQHATSRRHYAAPSSSEPATDPAPAAGMNTREQSKMREAAMSFEGIHKKLGVSSPQATTLASVGRLQLPLDHSRLHRVQAALRDRLPRDTRSALVSLRHKMSNMDGDGDGMLSEEELLRTLIDLAPSTISASDVGLLARHLREHASVPSAPASGSSAKVAASDVVHGRRISYDAMAGWLLGLAGGVEAVQPGPSSTSSSSAQAARVISQSGLAETGQTSAPRLDFASKQMAYTAFRAAWESKHGAAAKKEAELDAVLCPPDGPTWTRAEPQPFKVLHMAEGPPAAAGSGAAGS